MPAVEWEGYKGDPNVKLVGGDNINMEVHGMAFHPGTLVMGGPAHTGMNQKFLMNGFKQIAPESSPVMRIGGNENGSRLCD